MFKNKLSLLTLVTIVVIVAATIFVNLRAPQTAKEKVLFFPELATQIESVNHISIQGYAESINLTRKNDVWGIDEFDGYPALPEKVRSTVLGVADLRINAAKTALPRLYHRLGVEGPEVEDTTSLLLTLQDESANNIVNVIVGKPRLSSAAQTNPGLYVRKPEEAQSYLVDGVLELSETKTAWIERALFDVPADAIKSIRVVHSDGDTYTLFKNEPGQEGFELENLPPGKKITSPLIINRLGSLIQDMQISGARSQQVLAAGEDSIRVRMDTFEGVIIDIVAFDIDDIAYASFEASYDESLIVAEDKEAKIEELKAYTDRLNQHVANWWFEIQTFKYELMKKRSTDVIRDDDTPDVPVMEQKPPE